MICNWLANWEYLFSGESFKKIDAFCIRREKRSDVHTEDQRIRREISSRTKASQAKASLSENLSKIERLH